MCAIEAGKRGRRVLVIERGDQVGKKILISGGGRCNFTNLHVAPDNFISANPHFCKSALARYTPGGFYRDGRAARHRLSREKTRPTVLRHVREADRADAGGRMPGRPASNIRSGMRWYRRSQRNADGFQVQTTQGQFACRLRWWSPRAACRFRAWARPASAMSWRRQFGHEVAADPSRAGPVHPQRQGPGASSMTSAESALPIEVALQRTTSSATPF